MIEALKIKIDHLKNAYLPVGSLRARIAKGAFWSLVGAVIARGLSLVSSIIVARLLGTVGYGELGIIQSTVGMFGVFAGFGLGMTSTKYVAEFREKDPAKAGRIIALSSLIAFISGGIISLILILLSPFLATRTLSAPHLSNLLLISSGLLFLGAINGAQTGALSGFEAFRTIAIVNLLSGIISFPLLIAGVWFFKLEGAVIALIGSMFVNYILNKIAINKECAKFNIRPDFQTGFQELPVLWKFSLPAFLSSAMVGPVTWLCNAMLVNQPNGYAEMGIFNAANQWFNAFLFLPGIMSQVVVPILSERLGMNDNINSTKLLFFTIRTNGIIIFIIVVFGFVFNQNIMNFYGKGFESGGSTLIVVLLTAGLLAIQIPVGNVIFASGKMWLGFIINLGWGFVFITGTWLLIRFGSLGLASARLIAYIVHAVWTFWFASIFLKKTKREVLYD